MGGRERINVAMGAHGGWWKVKGLVGAGDCVESWGGDGGD